MPLKILLVEDDDDSRESSKELLERFGSYEILEARNGREGLEKAVSEIPDVIITDKNMPEMNGYEMAHKLKTDSKTSKILIFGNGNFSDEEKRILDFYFNKSEGTHPIYLKIKEFFNEL